MKYTSEEIKNRLSNIGEAIGTIALKYIVSLEQENEQLKKKISYLEDDLRVAKKDSEDLRNDIANGLKEFTKELPFTSLRLLANKQLKENIKNARKKLFDILTDYEIGNYDNNIHKFYKDVYDIHNELMDLEE